MKEELGILKNGLEAGEEDKPDPVWFATMEKLSQMGLTVLSSPIEFEGRDYFLVEDENEEVYLVDENGKRVASDVRELTIGLKQGETYKHKGKVYNTPEKIKKLKALAWDLIRQVLEDRPSAIIFMDKGARPISWILKEAWKNDRPKDNLPPFKFLDIGPVKRAVEEDEEKSKIITRGRYGEIELDEEESKKTWQEVEADEVLLKMLKDLYGRNKTVLVVDDYVGSGRTKELMLGFLQHHFPDIKFVYYSFFHELDYKTFSYPDGDFLGPWNPWNTEKEYSSVASGVTAEGKLGITAKRLEGVGARDKAKALKQEIKEIFKN